MSTGRFDVFYGFSQIEVRGQLPLERQMFDNLLRQVRLADELGFRTAWIGGAHLSLAEQHHSHPQPVLPHFRGEVCLNTDILQLAPVLFAQTRQIGVGSALHSILVNGGPVAQAEALRTFLTLKSLTPAANRTLRLGFGSGRFEFVHEVYGVAPRTDVERAAWPVVKALALREAATVFTRLVRGDALASDDLPPLHLTRASLRSDEDWARVVALHDRPTDVIEIAPFWRFDRLRIVPTESPLDTLRLYLGTTDRATVEAANATLPCRVFNLSSTPAEVIDATHAHLERVYHRDGGPWKRSYMPRTVLVFVDATRAMATERAVAACEAWQRAMDGTVDPAKVAAGMSNAVYGAPEDVAAQIHERYHPDDRLMLWFDFNDHDTGRVERTMEAFATRVAPLLEARGA